MRVIEIACVGERPRRLVGDRGNLAIHVEELAYVQAEAFHDVLESVGVHRLLESLAQQILPALWIGEMAVDCEHDIVGDEALGGGKEAEVVLHHAPLVFRQAVARFPEGDVGLHRDLRRHPMVVASARYFSHAQRYFVGKRWFTSARALIICFSSTLTREAPRAISPRPVASGGGLRSIPACRACSDHSSKTVSPYWQASQVGSSSAQAFALSTRIGTAETALSLPSERFRVDFSTWVAEREHR
jgi:hypothetical protein